MLPWWWWILGCGGREAPAEVDAGLPHFAEWEALARAVSRADLDAARVMARDLTEGPTAEAAGDPEALSRVGAALGFLQLAEDGEDLADGLVRAAQGCGACHAAAHVAPSTTPAWTHRDAARLAVSSLVFPGLVVPSPAGAADVPAPVGEAWASESDPAGRAGRVLRACQGCHSGIP